MVRLRMFPNIRICKVSNNGRTTSGEHEKIVLLTRDICRAATLPSISPWIASSASFGVPNNMPHCDSNLTQPKGAGGLNPAHIGLRSPVLDDADVQTHFLL